MLSGSQVIGFVLFDLVIILVAARFFGSAARRIGQPAVVGEIIAGVVLGPSVLGPKLLALRPDLSANLFGIPMPLLCEQALANTTIQASLTTCLFPPQSRAVLNGIGQLALLLFMFLVGLELDLDQLKGKGVQVATVAGGVVVIPLLIGLGIAPLLYGETFVADTTTVSSLGFGLFIGAFISITALPVMVRILQEKGMATSPLGIVGIASAAVVTVLMFVLVAIAAGVSTGAPTSGLVAKAVAAVVYLAVMMMVVRPLMARMLGQPYAARALDRGITSAKMTWSGVDEFSPSGAGQTLTHAMFAWTLVMVFASGWIAHILGINVIVGGFMAGLAMPANPGMVRDMTTELFDTVVTVLLPVFLAFAGLNADFTQLTVGAVPGIVLFVVACVVGKWGAGAVLGRMSGLTWNEGNLLGILMNCRGLLPLVVGLVGLQAGVISPIMNVAAVTMALITTGMTGPLFDRFNRPAPVRTGV